MDSPIILKILIGQVSQVPIFLLSSLKFPTQTISDCPGGVLD